MSQMFHMVLVGIAQPPSCKVALRLAYSDFAHGLRLQLRGEADLRHFGSGREPRMVSYRHLRDLRETDSEVLGNRKAATPTRYGIAAWIGLFFRT